MSKKKDSKQAGKVEKDDWKILIDHEKEDFVGYNLLETKVKITRYRKIKTKDTEQYQLVFDLTPFYPEGGGQVGDIGEIINESEKIAIIDTKKENKLIVHFTDFLPENINTTFTAQVNTYNRMNSTKNHTATHLLHESLRTILGDHVEQKGSLVNPKYLRFDFTHSSKIKKDDLKKIELDVNTKILANIPLDEHNNLSLSEAEKLGAIMLFGEKYEDVVRMIQFDTSKELCGGTHVGATGEIGLFKILSEGSISSGVRRIEAITGIEAINYLNTKEDLVADLRNIIKDKDIKEGVEQLITHNKELEKQIISLKKVNVGNIKQDLLNTVNQVNGVRFIAQEVKMDADDMKNVSFSLREEENLVLVLAAKNDKKALLTIMLTDDIVAKGYNAVVMIKDVAKEIEGSGGGQVFFLYCWGQ